MNSKREREIEMNKCMVMSYNGVLRITWFAVRAAMMCMVASALAASICAQTAAVVAPQFEVAGAFSYVRAKAANTGAGFDLNGGSASVAYNYRDRFAIVGDFGGYRFSGLGPGLSSTMYTYLAGPRIPLRRNRRLKPFVQVLAGGGRLTASSSGVNASESGFVMAPGAVLDFMLRHRLAVRIIEADYLFTRFAHPDGSAAMQNNFRISAGLVFRFGSWE
jgi:opacity protein-like surface antigen